MLGSKFEFLRLLDFFPTRRRWFPTATNVGPMVEVITNLFRLGFWAAVVRKNPMKQKLQPFNACNTPQLALQVIQAARVNQQSHLRRRQLQSRRQVRLQVRRLNRQAFTLQTRRLSSVENVPSLDLQEWVQEWGQQSSPKLSQEASVKASDLESCCVAVSVLFLL